MANELDRLLTELARDLGLAAPEMDGSGRTHFLVDGALEISLFQTGDRIYLEGRIQELPVEPAEREAMLASLLRRHLARQVRWHEVLCLDPESSSLMLYRALPARTLDAAGFRRTLGELTNALDYWSAETETGGREALSQPPMRMLFP